jgi:hypothetical protein
VTGFAGGERLAVYLIGRACHGLPAEIRAERYQEWAAELPAILGDPDVRLAPVRTARALGFAVGTCTSARRLRSSGNDRIARLPRCVLLAAGAVIIWVAAVETSTTYPLNGPAMYVYVAAGGVSETFAILAVVRAIRWLVRRFTRARRS